MGLLIKCTIDLIIRSHLDLCIWKTRLNFSRLSGEGGDAQEWRSHKVVVWCRASVFHTGQQGQGVCLMSLLSQACSSSEL